MGREQSSGNAGVIFLCVAFGKIRQKKTDSGEDVNKDTPNSVLKVTQSGVESWAIEYDAISGIIEKITLKEDSQYGNSFDVVLVDGIEKFQLSIKEKGNFAQPFLSSLPNVILDNPVRISAWDYENKEGKRKVGLSIGQNGNPNATEFNKVNVVDNFYGDWVDKKFIPKNGLPSSNGVNWKDEDSRDEFNLKLRRFFRNEFKTRIEPMFENFTPKNNPVDDDTGFPDSSTVPNEIDNDTPTW